MSKINRPRASRASCALVTGRIEPVHRVHSVHRVPGWIGSEHRVHRVPGQIDPVHRVQFRVGFKYKYVFVFSNTNIFVLSNTNLFVFIDTVFVFKYLKKKNLKLFVSKHFPKYLYWNTFQNICICVQIFLKI